MPDSSHPFAKSSADISPFGRTTWRLFRQASVDAHATDSLFLCVEGGWQLLPPKILEPRRRSWMAA